MGRCAPGLSPKTENGTQKLFNDERQTSKAQIVGYVENSGTVD
jgi:hypothetical protein